jgi:hypothetical protein
MMRNQTMASKMRLGDYGLNFSPSNDAVRKPLSGEISEASHDF